jgi:hypothetical protein
MLPIVDMALFPTKEKTEQMLLSAFLADCCALRWKATPRPARVSSAPDKIKHRHSLTIAVAR